MKKRLLSMLLASAMTAGLMAGCGSDTATGSASSEKTSESTVEDTGAAGTDYSGKKVLRVGMECAYAPFNWTQETDQVSNGDTAVPIYGTEYYAYGYDVMMAQKIADYLGWDLEIHKVEWSSIGLSLDSGDYDCIIAGMGWTEDREISYDFTSAYYIRETVVTCKEGSDYASAKTLDDLKGAKATTQLSTVWVNDLTEIPDVQLVGNFETTSECFMAVENGVADICVIDKPTTESAFLTNSGLVMLSLDEDGTFSDAFTDVCIAVRDGDSELQGLIQEALDSFDWDQEKMDEMMSLAVELQPAAN